jgi:hypothetical protein
MKTIQLLCLLALTLAPLGAAAQSDDGSSVLENGSFRKNGTGWEAVKKGESGEVDFIEDDVSFVRLSPTASSYPDFIIVQRSFVPTEDGEFIARAKIRLSPDYDPANPPAVSFNVFNPEGSSEVYAGFFVIKPGPETEPDKWVDVETTFTVPAGCPRIYVQCIAYGTTGHADFTNLTLTKK